MPAAQDRAQQFDFYKYLRIFWRRKWLLIIPLVVCGPLSMYVAYLCPEEYRSKAILEMQIGAPQVEAGRERINVHRELSTVQQNMLGWNEVYDIILSRKVDFDEDIDPDNRRQIERLYNKIFRRTRVSARGLRHIEVAHKSGSPERNATLVNELVKRYVGENRREAQQQAQVDVDYFREKLAAVKARLDEIDRDIRDFTTANPWLRDELSELHRDLKDAEQEEEAVRQELAELNAQLAELNKELAKTDPEITETRKVEPSPEVLAARRQYEQMQTYFRQVNERYTPAHRMWRDAKRRLDEAKAHVDEIDKGDEVEEITTDNPKYAQLQVQITALVKNLERSSRRRLDANQKVNRLSVDVKKAPELLAERKRLDEQRATVQSDVSDLGKKFRASDKELQRLLNEAYSTKFKVREYARPDGTPVKSTQIKIVALGIMVGMLTGVGLIVLIEYLDQTFKTIDDARAVLGIPALGVIPAIFTPRDHRRRLWFRVLAVSSAVFLVGVAVTLYLAVPPVQAFIKDDVWVTLQEAFQRF